MAIKFIVLLSVVMYASAGDLAYPATAYTYAAPATAFHHEPAATVAYHHAPAVAYHQAPAVAYHHTPAVAYHHAPAYGSTSQQVIRSYGGTVSQYSKAVDTPYSSVRKQDTRITNKLYSPSLVQYTAPAAHHHIQYAAAVQPAAYTAAHHGHAHYSPAAVVSHVSFDGLGAHYAW